MNIHKFSGLSLGSIHTLSNLKTIVAQEKGPTIVVVSALEGVTAQLAALMDKQLRHHANVEAEWEALRSLHTHLAQPLLDQADFAQFCLQVDHTLEATAQTLLHAITLQINDKSLEDYVLATGSQLSAALVGRLLDNATVVDGRQLIRTNDTFGHAGVDGEATCAQIRACCQHATGVMVVSGSCGQTAQGYTTHLGQGGSDLTATLLAAALKAQCVTIWTTQDGIFNADPALYPNAYTIPLLSYAEAAELSHAGTKLLYPPAIWPAVREDIPLRIANVLQPAAAGTLINHFGDVRDKRLIKGISTLPDIHLITVYGYGMLERVGTSRCLFGLLADNGINVVFISQASSEFSISVGVAACQGQKALHALEHSGLFENSRLDTDLSIVALAGNNMRNTPGTCGKICSTLGNLNINIVATAQGGAELNISVVIPRKDLEKAIAGLAEL